MSEGAEAAFAAFDFDTHEAWRLYRANINLPPGIDEESAIEAVKIKWYRRNVVRKLPRGWRLPTHTGPRLSIGFAVRLLSESKTEIGSY